LPGLLAALACGSGFVFWALPTLRAEALRYPARLALNRLSTSPLSSEQRLQAIHQADLDLSEAVRIAPSHASAWADLSYARSLEARERPETLITLGREAEKHARQALALSPAPHEAWIRLGVALDMQGRWLEAGTPFTEAVARAPSNITARYYLAYHLAHNALTRSVARGLVDSCLRIDPGHAPSLALRDLLATAQR
jgi:tetratricopeptide (TPR) repeat protein